MQGELFDPLDQPAGAPVGPAPTDPTLARVAARLPPGVRLGTSSWSFPGWAGLVWDRRTDPGVLARHGLAAYARHPLLGAVGVDRTYYRPLGRAEWRRFAGQVPAGFRFLVKATRTLVTPGHPAFLDPDVAAAEVVEPAADGLGERLGPVVIQIPPLRPREAGDPARFADRLRAFLESLPRGPLYAVEGRTPALLGEEWAAALHAAGAAHVYTVHPRAPSLESQARAVPPGGQPAVVVRWMLGGGRRYEEARERYRPFDRLVDPDPRTRDAVARLVEAAVAAGRGATVIVNNKAEGSSPLSVIALAGRLADGPTARPAASPGGPRPPPAPPPR